MKRVIKRGNTKKYPHGIPVTTHRLGKCGRSRKRQQLLSASAAESVSGAESLHPERPVEAMPEAHSHDTAAPSNSQPANPGKLQTQN